MSKGLQHTGKYIRAVIEVSLEIYGEAPVSYVAARLESIRREAFKNPSEAPADVPPQWLVDPPTRNLRHQMRKEVKRVVTNHTDFRIRLGEDFDYICWSEKDYAILPRDWQHEINKELRKHRPAD